VGKTEKGCWYICRNTYEIDGVEIPRGRMIFSLRPIFNNDWRVATPEEVETKQWYKGHYFNLKYV